MAQVDPLSSSLEIAGAFSNTGVPVELVEAENQSVEAVLSSNNNGRQQGGVAANPPNVGGEEAMDISVEGDQNLDSTQLSAVPKSVEVPVPTVPNQAGLPSANVGANVVGSSLAKALASASTSTSSVATNTPLPATQSTAPLSGTSAQTHAPSQQQTISTGVNAIVASSAQQPAVSSALNPTRLSTGVAVVSAIEQLSQSLGTHQALEIAADAISSLPDNLGQLASSQDMHDASGVADRTREMFSDSMNFSGLDMSGTSALNASAAIDAESPSSPESNFDTNDLLNSSLLQQDEVTQRLAQSGPIGVAAAAAIMSSRKRKRSMTFETNPSLRKRHCSKLSKKLKETIDEMSMRVGLQAVVVMYKPGKSNAVGASKNEPSFKVFGAAPLSNVVKNQKNAIVAEMEAALHQHGPIVTQTPSKLPTSGDAVHELPPLVFDGIPTPVHKMTQAQLRTFIPNMLKFSTGRGKPGWGKDEIKPAWWPNEVPWANVRSDIRTDEQKKQLPWTDALRRIVLSCYIHHSRIDLLPEFSIEQLQQIFSPESTQQLQLQLESFQQQQTDTPATTAESAENVTIDNATAAVSMETSASEGPANQDAAPTDNQQVFTVDTGIGSCDTTGMPTLADASLAETAARLQQVADETGEVQYATQTVTVTERDAKALGQPVGSTTTVLLTAYPGGHNGAAAGGAGEGVSTAAQPAASDNNLVPTSQQGSSSTNVQVVYSAAQVESISDSIGTNTTSTVPIQTGTETLSAGLVSSTTVATGASEVTSVTSAINTVLSAVATTTPDSTIGDVVGSEYLNPSATQEMIMGGAESGGNNAGDAPTDLATQLINEYTSGGDGTAFGEVKSVQDQPGSNQPNVVPEATPPVPTSTEN